MRRHRSPAPPRTSGLLDSGFPAPTAIRPGAGSRTNPRHSGARCGPPHGNAPAAPGRREHQVNGEQEYGRLFRHIPPTAPPLRLAGADDDALVEAEPHIVRGID